MYATHRNADAVYESVGADNILRLPFRVNRRYPLVLFL